MKIQKTPHALLLELVEERIGQMDAFNRRDAQDLDVLLRCREKLKLAARGAGLDDHATYVATIETSAYALGRPALIQEVLSPNFDVI